MKIYSRVLSLQSLENIYVLKLASEASQENFAKFVFLTTKHEQIVNSEHLLCPKVGGHKPTCAPTTFESGEARAPLPPFSYALVKYLLKYTSVYFDGRYRPYIGYRQIDIM